MKKASKGAFAIQTAQGSWLSRCLPLFQSFAAVLENLEMDREEINRLSAMLFCDVPGSVAKDYLAFLALRVPENIEEQLKDDGQPDITMPHQTVRIEDLVNPLSSGAFPADNLFDLASLLGFIVIGYEIAIEAKERDEDAYTMIYAASLYLHCFITGDMEPTASGYLHALRVMTTMSLKLDLPSRLQVCRFLASLVPAAPLDPPEVDTPEAPISSLLLVQAVILSSIVSDISVLAEHVAGIEHLHDEWKSWHSTSVVELRNLVSQAFGPAGRIRNAADRLFLTIGE
ncbi:MAG: hypothetical protein GX621_04535 [Pirellulaceae bacterium]|nr:hypothetical protein [Pirellulaceae bacterium]